MLRRSTSPLRLGVTLFFAAAVCALATPAAMAQEIPPDHQRPLLTPWEEAAWLQQLVAQSPHRLALEAAIASGAPVPAGPALQGPVGKLAPPPPPAAWPKKPGRKLLGYLPYWTMKTALLPWKTLTQLAYFSAGLSGSGVITSNAGWGGPDAKALIAKAHANGVQVVLTITQFTSASISQILATPASRTKAINAIVAEVLAGGGDGVNIDFEGLPKADRDEMKAFIAELTATMHAKLPGSDVTLATPCVDWSGAWDYQYLAEHSDGLMVMAYAIHWSGGAPGPQLPMAKLAPWTHKTLQWVIDDYVLYAKVQNKPKIIIGLPLYGYKWLSTTNKPGAAQLEKGTSIFFDAAQVEAAKAGGFLWDKASESSWFVKPSGTAWLQTWCDDFKAFQMRVDYLHASDVMMGLWALGYADKHPEVWTAIEVWQAKGAPPKPVDGGSDAGKDVAGDAGADVAKDAGADATPDAAKDAVADAGPDLVADTGPDLAEDVAVDTGPDGAADSGPEAIQEVAADAALPDVAKDAGPPPPDAAAVDAAQAEVSQPEVSQPEVSQPEIAQADVAQADAPQADAPAADPAPDAVAAVDAVARQEPDGIPADASRDRAIDAGSAAAGAAVAPAAASGCGAARAPGTGSWAWWGVAAGLAWAVRRRRSLR